MIVSDIQTRIKRQFGDESGVQVTNDDIVRWINDGQRHIVKNNEGLLEVTALSSLVDGQYEYSMPADLLILKAVHLKNTDETSFFKLRGFKFTEFNEYVDGWDGTNFNEGRPFVYTTHANKIILFPTPDRNVSNALKIYYNRTPTDVTGPADTPDLPLLYHDALVNYCLQQAYEMDEDFEAATAKAVQLDSDIKTLRGRDDWKQQDTYPVITIMADDL